MLIVSIDVGLYHLGLIACTFKYEGGVWLYRALRHMELVNLTEFKCDQTLCKLDHAKSIADYLSHFFIRFRTLLDESYKILVEAQPPPAGFIAIQEMIRMEYRRKVELIQPRVVHVWFRIQSLDYEHRKRFTVRLAERLLVKHFNITTIPYTRKHDIGDALVQLQYFISKFNEVKRSRHFNPQCG